MRSWRRGLLTRWEVALGVALFGGVAAVAVPVLQNAVLRVRAAEAPWMLDELLAAQLAHHAAHGAYFPVGITPRSLEALGSDLVAWPAGSPAGFVPPTPEVRCTYWADTSPDLVLHAACDLDGDSADAQFSLRPHGAVVRLTPEGVW